jgi:hypothetical protein
MDLKAAAYKQNQLDRNIVAASGSVDSLCKRQFFPEDTTRTFDWPNWQYAYPWRLWLDANELALDQIDNPNTVLSSGGVAIPNTAFFCRNKNYAPPYTRIELDRSQNYSFGNGDTPQLDIWLYGTFGATHNPQPASQCVLASAIGNTTTQTVLVSEGDTPGVGDLILIDSERMLVQDKQPVNTGITFSAGVTTPQVTDVLITVPSVTAFTPYEVIRIDAERMLILDYFTATSQLLVKRAWDGTLPVAHNTGTDIFAFRQLIVVRGAVGTTSSTHDNGAVVNVFVWPSLVKELAVAEAEVGMIQEPGGYTFGLTTSTATVANVYGSTGHGQQREPAPGLGLSDIRARCADQHARKARSRVI